MQNQPQIEIPTLLVSDFGVLGVTCGVKMMSLHTGLGWQPTQTASCIHIIHIQRVWAHWYAVHAHMAVASNSYTHPTLLILCGSGFWVTGRVKMMSLHHGWGWQPTYPTSHIQIIHIQSVWAHWYAVHGYMVVSSNSYTHLTWLIFCGSGPLVESKWCHYVMVEANSHLKILSASISYIYKVFEHIDMLSMGIWH